jgi:hypothetical protein
MGGTPAEELLLLIKTKNTAACTRVKGAEHGFRAEQPASTYAVLGV